MTTEYAFDERAADRAAARGTVDFYARMRLERLHAKRPAVYAKPGDIHPEVRAWCERLLAGDAGTLLLVGSIGVGKTWNIWAAAEYLILRGWTGRFERAGARELKRACTLPVDRDRLDAWAAANLFALDDLGAQSITDWDSDHIAAIIDERWEEGRPMMITSNDGDFVTLLGDRSSSRSRDNATVVMMAGADRRELRA
ncbi:ATP-binding protein [Nocardiopsis synnemataformans]|uniref:ATP-binding protein n=1 Tax=Nocardiopsis synnemataformans TaxID=61305 RepID=UPI003EBB5E60